MELTIPEVQIIIQLIRKNPEIWRLSWEKQKLAFNLADRLTLLIRGEDVKTKP